MGPTQPNLFLISHLNGKNTYAALRLEHLTKRYPFLRKFHEGYTLNDDFLILQAVETNFHRLK